jgi:hypothetical protein
MSAIECGCRKCTGRENEPLSEFAQRWASVNHGLSPFLPCRRDEARRSAEARYLVSAVAGMTTWHALANEG